MGARPHRPRSIIAVSAVAAVAAACAPSIPQPASDTVCSLRMGPWSGKAASARGAARDKDFVRLLLRDGRRQARSCTAVALPSAPPRNPCTRDDEQSAWERTPPFAALVERVRRDEYLAWVGTHRRGEAELFGPIARVARTAVGLEVRALGVLRGPAGNLALERLAMGAGEAYLLAGDRCDRPGVTGSCARTARVVLVRPPRMGPALWATRGTRRRCPVRIALQRRVVRFPGSGRERSYLASSVVEPVAGGLTIEEHVAVERPVGPGGDATSRTVREVSSVRRMHLHGVHLQPDKRSLLSRLIHPARHSHATRLPPDR